jgi:hypothetical protein
MRIHMVSWDKGARTACFTNYESAIRLYKLIPGAIIIECIDPR